MNAHPWWTISYIVISIVSLNVFHVTHVSVHATSCSEPNVIEDDILGDKKRNRNRRAATSSQKKLWPGGVIPYVITDTFTNATKSLIRESMDHWQSYTCLDFVKRTNEKDYIYIYSGKGCCSYVGKRGGKQELSLGRGCDSFGIIVHELGHAVGFWHEQSRPDRDNYVKILYQNVHKKNRHNFRKIKERDVNSRQQRYDYHSIMHYGSDFYSQYAGKDTILPLLRGVKKDELGRQYFSRHGYALSDQDTIQTNLMYRCNIFNGNGGTIFARSGSFHSPNYPAPYPVSRDRVWIITTEKTRRSSLTLIFQNFSVGNNEGTGICRNDYLDIRNGKGFLAPHLIQFCGSVTPDPITILSESIYVRLHSKLPIHKSVGLKKGFSVKFKTDECSSRMSRLRDTFLSPNFQRRYLPNTDCVWQINVPEGYRIKMTFYIFQMRDVDNKKGCLDYVDLRDGDSPFSTFFGRFCGNNNPGTVYSASTSFRVIFHSTTPHSQESARGFAASYEAIDVDECVEKTSDCEQACFNKKGGYLCGCKAGYSFIPGVYGACVDKNECETNNGGCSHGCENTDGGFYCTCPEGHYLVSEGKVCTDINECDLMPCAHGCENYVGSFQCLCNNGFELNDDQRTCKDINECEQSPCEQKCINTRGGYKCSCNSGYIFDEEENTCKALPTCGHIYKSTSGEILSPRVPRLLPHPVECEWTIKVPRAKVIDLNVLISWKKDQECSNYLHFSYKTGGSHFHLRFCGQEDVNGNRLIKTNNLWIKYHVEPETMNYMTVKYTSSSKDSQCKRTFTTSSGIIETPGFPGNYPSNTHCQWTIKNTMKRPLRVQFNFFEVENHTSCKYDYLDIRITGNTRYDGKYCGTHVAQFLNIYPGKEMRMLFKSDSTIQRRGFHADFQLV